MTLLHGDSLLILPTLPANSVDCICTDPPYSSGGMMRGDRMQSTSTKYVGNNVQMRRPEFSGDNRDQRSFAFWSILWLAECFRIAREGAVVMVFTDWRQLPVTTDVLQAAGFVWRGIVVWDKSEGVRPQLGRFRSQAEYVVWGTKGPFPSEGSVLPGVYRYPTAIEEKKRHIAAKPQPLMASLLRIIPKPKEDRRPIILDPFLGSGTTGAAAIQMDMDFIGIEMDTTIYTQAAQWLTAIEAKHAQNIFQLGNMESIESE